ncbi:hypothetical protein MKW98_019261 [Papaver atlanticum]|uniref:Uncharacterized protein n=1 Tax=Papaver atlanticum TaxID=357466 RepID=A0AAD4TC51_9MAGN|nr:hypothetical protein MKW98_019261 [Papaver atlanticum]
MSCLSQASRVGTNTTQGSSQPCQEKFDQPSQENFNHDYWFNVTQGSIVYNDENESEDEENVQLENTELDECNPVEDSDAPLIFDSDEDDEVDYAEYLKTYKVPADNDESSSSEVVLKLKIKMMVALK